MQHYLDAKHEADEYLKNSDLKYMIVRPVALTNEDETKKVHAAESVDSSASISRADVASTLLLSAVSAQHINKTFEIAQGSTPLEQAYASI